MRQKPGDEFWFRVGSIPTIVSDAKWIASAALGGGQKFNRRDEEQGHRRRGYRKPRGLKSTLPRGSTSPVPQ